MVMVNEPSGPATPLPKGEIDQYIDEFRANLGSLDGFDVVHSHHWMSGVAALPLARAAGIPHLMTFHSVAAHPNSSLRDGEPPESPARLAGEITCATESDLVVAVSRHEAAVVIGRCQADPERVVVVRPGVDLELFHPAAPSAAAHETIPEGVRPGYVLFAARLQPLKAPDLAIAAVAGLPEDERPDLVLVGQAPADLADYEAELHRLADSTGTRVAFLPGQDREGLARLLRHASVVLVPSYSETFGLIALEASASGVPVLAAAAGGLTEAICNTHTGLLVPTHEPADWSEALGSLLRDPERRAEMGRTGRRRAEEMTWARAAEQTLAAYRRAVAAGRVVAFLHAHPDDESSQSAATMARYVAEGAQVTLVTCTLGELGEILVPDWAHFTPGELGGHRQGEIAVALAEIGVTDHVYLGGAGRYHDSGMARDEKGAVVAPDDMPDNAFWRADLLEAADHLVEVIRSRRPQVLVTYDPFGNYGHPDHVQAHRVAMYATVLAAAASHRPDLGARRRGGRRRAAAGRPRRRRPAPSAGRR